MMILNKFHLSFLISQALWNTLSAADITCQECLPSHLDPLRCSDVPSLRQVNCPPSSLTKNPACATIKVPLGNNMGNMWFRGCTGNYTETKCQTMGSLNVSDTVRFVRMADRNAEPTEQRWKLTGSAEARSAARILLRRMFPNNDATRIYKAPLYHNLGVRAIADAELCVCDTDLCNERSTGNRSKYTGFTIITAGFFILAKLIFRMM